MLVRPLPKWAMQRYASLWATFSNKEFSYEDAARSLKSKDAKLVSVILSYLKKYGWLAIRLNLNAHE